MLWIKNRQRFGVCPMTRSHYILESGAEVELFRALFPEEANAASSLEDWVGHWSEETLRSTEERAALFASLLTPAQLPQAPFYLKTIELLREALVLTPEHAEHCFSELPQTPKNQELQELFLAYLHSPLAEDKTARLWRLLGHLKENRVSLPEGTSLTFVRAKPPSFLYIEKYSSVRYDKGLSEISIQYLADLGGGDRIRRPILFSGRTSDCLEKMASHLSRFLSSGVSPNAIWVPFQGEAHLLAWLRLRIGHKGVSLSLFQEERAAAPQESESPDTLEVLFANIRQDHSIPLSQRLRLTSKLMGDPLGKRPSLSVAQFLDRLVERHKISEEEKTYALALNPRTPSAPARSDGGVRITPFLALPPSCGYVLAFCDQTLFQNREKETLLWEAELELLFQRGFTLPRASLQRAHALKQIQKMATIGHGRRALFTSLSRDLIPETTKVRPVRPRRRVEAEGSSSYNVQLPARSLSATQFESYARCPTQYLFSNRFRLSPLQRAESKMALLFGQTAHRALELFFSKPHSNDRDPMIAGLLEHFSTAVQEAGASLDPSHPLHVILKNQFKQIAEKMPALETQLKAISGGAIPIEFEAPFEIPFLPGVSIRGKIDRIDRRADGALLILDYKTGAVDFTPEQIARGEHFQALIYLLAMGDKPSAPCLGILFYDLKKGEIRRGLLLEEVCGADAKKLITRGHTVNQSRYEELEHSGTLALRKIALAMAEGLFEPTPSPDICGTCEFVAHCRRGASYA